jgi:hypothetical protein
MIWLLAVAFWHGLDWTEFLFRSCYISEYTQLESNHINRVFNTLPSSLSWYSSSWIDKSFRYAHGWLFYTRLDSILPLYSVSLEMAALLPYPSFILGRHRLIMERHKQWMAEHLIKISRDVRRRWCQDWRWAGSGRSVTAQVAELRTTANATGSSKHPPPRTTISPCPILSLPTTAHFFTEPLRPT